MIHGRQFLDGSGCGAVKLYRLQSGEWTIHHHGDVGGRVESQSSVLFGRDAEIERARASMLRIIDGHRGPAGGVVMLSGASGAGKSSLASAIIDEAEGLGFSCFRTACEPFHEGMSYFPVRELVRQMAGGRPVGAVIGELFGPDAPEVEMAAVSESIAADPSSRREAIVATFTNVIMGEYRGGSSAPKLLFVDDLEHLDAGSADALICLISRLSEGPVLILGAYRADLVASSKHPLRPVIASARRMEGVYQHLDIAGFNRTSFTALVEVLLDGPAELPAAFVQKLFNETEGNPLFTREVVRMLSVPDGGSGRASLRRVDGVWRFDGDVELWDIPDSVEEVIASRLDLLDPDQRRELEVAAVVGRRFAFTVLCGLMEAGEDDLLRDLETFLDFDLIRELAMEDDTFEFSHGKIRDVLYAQLSGLRKRRLHGQVAEVISTITTSTNEDWDALIGEHLFLAAKHADAFPYLLRAARNAQATGAAGEAAGLFKKALESSTGAILEGDDSRASIQLELIGALITASDVASAGTLAEQMVTAATPPELRVTALNLLGDVLLFEGEVDQARDAYEQSLEIADSLGDREALCEVLCDLAELHGRQYERLAALSINSARTHQRLYVESVERAYEMQSSVRSRALQARILRNKAKLSRVSGDLAEAEALYRRAIETVDARVSGHRFLVPYAKTLRRSGKTDQALENIEKVLSWSTQVGSVRSQAIAWQYKATFLMTRKDGPLAEALSAADQALRSHRSIGYVQGIRETQIVLGEIQIRLGDLDAASQYFRSSVPSDQLSEDELFEAIAVELDANGEEDRASAIRAARASDLVA